MVICIVQKDIGIEISRFCTLNNYTVLGGFSKFLSFIKREFPQANLIFGWCDLRYANGQGYEKTGFSFVKDILNWAWTDFNDVYTQLSEDDERKSIEAEYAQEMNLVQIYDAGQRLYLKQLN